MRNFKSLVRLALACILFFSLNTIYGQTPQPVEFIGVGVPIIQGFQDGHIIVNGMGCDKTQITLYNSSGEAVLQSPVFSGTLLNWEFSTTGKPPGIYTIQVYSVVEDCVAVKQILVR